MKWNKIKKFEGKLTKVRIVRNISDEVYTNGFIHYVNKDIVIMQVFHDFYCEGYGVYRTKDIVSFRSNKFEKKFKKMLKNEGLLKLIKKPDLSKLKTVKNILEHFIKSNTNIIVECESLDDDNSEFHIGRPTEIEGKTLWFIGFDALGKWYDEEIGLSIKNITKIQFDTPYINIFSKYVKN